ncbi:MAG: type II toxin-antitoxin system death-on-curing family toxin [Promethearchaeota archaeon]
MNRGGLEAILDKVQWGIPYQPEPTIWDRVAILYQGIVEQHYFANGNKRIGLLMSIIFLEKNGYSFETTNDDAYEFTIQVAQSLKTYKEIKSWFAEKSRKKEY